MANLSKVIYINEVDYSTLLNGGTITKGGVTYSHDPTALYVIKNVSAPEYAETAGYATTAGQATKATQDGGGNVISDTYAKKVIIGELTYDEDNDSYSCNKTYSQLVSAILSGDIVLLEHEDGLYYLTNHPYQEEGEAVGPLRFRYIGDGSFDENFRIYSDNAVIYNYDDTFREDVYYQRIVLKLTIGQNNALTFKDQDNNTITATRAYYTLTNNRNDQDVVIQYNNREYRKQVYESDNSCIAFVSIDLENYSLYYLSFDCSTTSTVTLVENTFIPVLPENADLGQAYGISSDNTNSAVRTSSISGFKLKKGGIVAIKFTTGINITGPSLNISSTGSKPIYYRGSAPPRGTINAGDTVTFIYDGTYYHIISIDPNPATTAPIMDGTAAVGSSTKYAREDHVHPSDTSKANVADLATVATSGSYNDLSNKPTIPAAVTVDSSLTGSSQTNPVQGGAIYSALQGKEDRQQVIVDIQCEVNYPVGFSIDGDSITGEELYLLCADPKKDVVFRINGYDNDENNEADYDEDILYHLVKDSLASSGIQYFIGLDEFRYRLLSFGLCIDDEGSNIYFDAGIEELDYLPTNTFNSRKINNKPLSSDITLTASDIGAITRFVVDFTLSGTTISNPNKTFLEIKAAYDAGNLVLARDDTDGLYYLLYCEATGCGFFCCDSGTLYTIEVDSSDTWTYQDTNISQLELELSDKSQIIYMQKINNDWKKLNYNSSTGTWSVNNTILTGNTKNIYLDKDNNDLYYWDGSAFVLIDEDNVQSDWNQSDSTKADYIKNKPVIPNSIKVGSVAGKLYRDDVNGGGNFTVKGNSGCIPNLTAGTFLVSIYAKSDTQSYTFKFNFGSVSYNLSTTNGEINDVREITIPSDGTFSGSVLNGSVAPGTILYVVMYDYLTPVSTVGVAAVTNRYSDLDGTPTIPGASNTTPLQVRGSSGNAGSSGAYARADHKHAICKSFGSYSSLVADTDAQLGEIRYDSDEELFYIYDANNSTWVRLDNKDLFTPLIVNITRSNDVYSCNKTNAEIYAAWQAGRDIYVKETNEYLFPLASEPGSTFAYFMGSRYDEPYVSYTVIITTSNNTQTVSVSQTQFVPTSRTINGHALSSNLYLTVFGIKGQSGFERDTYNSSNGTWSGVEIATPDPLVTYVDISNNKLYRYDPLTTNYVDLGGSGNITSTAITNLTDIL